MELFRITSSNVVSYGSLGFNLSGFVQNEVFPILFDPEPASGYGMSWKNLECASRYILTTGTDRENRVRL